jgi:hypothetical protein
MEQTYKVISVLQPWASLLVLGHKTIETRSWNTQHRGKLLVHASLGKTYKTLRADNPLYKHYHLLFAQNKIPPIEQLPFGAIIGSVNLIGTAKSEVFFTAAEGKENGFEISEQEKTFGDYSPNRYGWLCQNPIVFKNPIPAKGQLNLWNWRGIIE